MVCRTKIFLVMNSAAAEAVRLTSGGGKLTSFPSLNGGRWIYKEPFYMRF